MRQRLRKPLAMAALALFSACGPAHDDPIGPTSTTLPAGISARVGPIDVPASWVAKVAAARKFPLAAARELAVQDALFASGALARSLDRAPEVQAAFRARLARANLEALSRETKVAPVSDDEVAAATEQHFTELDRPEAFRTIHVVVVADAKSAAALRTRARAHADALARALAGSSDPAEFRRRVEAVPAGDLSVKVEELQPVAADGRVVDARAPGQYDPAFAAGAARLSRVGEISPVVESSFGYHVLMLTERTPAYRVPLEERRRMLKDEIINGRAGRSSGELVRRLRAEKQPSVERSADTLLQLVPSRAP